MATAETMPITEVLAIEHACTRLCLDYSFHADRQEMDAWTQLFAEDAELHLFGQVHKGRAAIRASVNRPEGSPDMASVHSLHNIRIDVVSPTEARGNVGIALFAAPKVAGVGQAKDISPAIVGAYQDVYKKTAEGWKFARRGFATTITKTPP